MQVVFLLQLPKKLRLLVGSLRLLHHYKVRRDNVGVEHIGKKIENRHDLFQSTIKMFIMDSNVVGEMLELLIRFLEASASNFSPDTRYPNSEFFGCPRLLQKTVEIILSRVYLVTRQITCEFWI
jgi:hypothetical protein